MDKKNKRVRHLSLLLFFLLGGVIVGETVSLTMVVTAFGPGVLGKLFFVNGLLLLLLPPLFFNRIDTINRGTFLTAQFCVTAAYRHRIDYCRVVTDTYCCIVAYSCRVSGCAYSACALQRNYQ